MYKLTNLNRLPIELKVNGKETLKLGRGESGEVTNDEWEDNMRKVETTRDLLIRGKLTAEKVKK